jgi:hypothetical protein
MSEFSMDGFYTDPWGAYDTPLSDSYLDWVPDVVSQSNDTPAYSNAPQSVTLLDTTASNPISSSGWTTPSFNGDSFLKGLQNFTDWGLKVSGTVFAANNAAKDQQLNNYLKRSQVDIMQTQATSAQRVAGIQATTAGSLAMMRANAANTGAVGANLGAAVGNNSLMLWLTVAGVLFAFIQVMQSARN